MFTYQQAIELMEALDQYSGHFDKNSGFYIGSFYMTPDAPVTDENAKIYSVNVLFDTGNEGDFIHSPIERAGLDIPVNYEDYI